MNHRVYRLPGRCVVSGVEELRQRVDAVVAVGSPVAARRVVVDRQLMRMLLLLPLLVLLTLGGHLGAVRLHHARCRLRRRRRTLLARGRRRRRFARGLLIIIIIFLPNNS